MKTSSFILISILMMLFSCNSKTETPAESIKASAEISTDEQGLSNTKAIIKTAHGNITFKFYPKEAPSTTTRIMQLIEEGFYDGLTFHRVVPDFVIQGGDPKGNGTGGSGINLKAEFNSIQHIKGTVAMARSQDVNSADSQFYIALSRLPHLDNNYTVFGQVVEGMDILDKIVMGDKIISISLSK
jgi:cyclophilin family peptidyl-prolyl cis-trans isomerase